MKIDVKSTNGNSQSVDIELDYLVIGGWAGRDHKEIEHHIEELAALGVPAPSTVPLYYRSVVSNLTTASKIQVLDEHSSGEAEAVFIRQGDKIYVTVGSDHTDRKLESHSIAASKQITLKPIGAEAWDFAEVEPHWDDLILRAWITVDGQRTLYQEGSVTKMIHPRDLFAKFNAAGLPDRTAIFGGTFAVIGGIRPAAKFEAELDDPILGRKLTMGYTIETLPVIA